MSVRTDTVNLYVNIGGDKAKDELNQLRKKSADISAEMKGLKKGTQEYIDKASELKKVTADMDKLRKSIGLSAMTQKELVNELNRLKAMRGSLTPQTKEFDNLSKKIKEVETRLYDVRNGVFGFRSTLSKIGDSVKQFGVLAAGYLGFEFVMDSFKNIIGNAGKVSDKLADVRRVTGLSNEAVKELHKSFREFDTRTATSQLLDYAKIAGKLGIASDDIGDFVKATDMLVTAMGDELGDADAITENIGKIINIYDKGAKITGERTMQIGNAIIDLANKGVASGSFIVDFTKRLAGIANTANVSLQESIGLAAGLEELGQTSETSSTAVTQLITKVGQDLPKYAKLAGKDLKEFAETMKASPVEALLQLAEGLTKNKSGFAEIAVAFKDAEASGVRVTSTLGVLGQKADFLRSKIGTANTALKNTSEITEAYRLKNETLGATLEKIGKKMASWFTSGPFLDFLERAARGFGKLIGASGEAATALEEFESQGKKVAHLEKDIVPLINRIEELNKKTVLNATEQREMKTAIDEVARAIPYAVTEFDKYGKAIGINTEKAREYIRIQQLILQEKNREAIAAERRREKELLNQLKDQAYFERITRKRLDDEVFGKNLEGKLGYTGESDADKKITAAESELAKVLEKTSRLQDQLAGTRGLIAELSGGDLNQKLDAIKASVSGSGSAGIPTSEDELKAQEKREKEAQKSADRAQEEALRRLEALQKEMEDIRIRIHQDGMNWHQKEYDEIKRRYERLLKEAGKNAAIVLELNKLEGQELSMLEKKVQDEISGHIKEGQKEQLALEKEQSEKRIEDRLKILNKIDEMDQQSYDRDAERIEKERKKKQEADDEEAKKWRGIKATFEESRNFLFQLNEYTRNEDQIEFERELKKNELRRQSYDRLLSRKVISQQKYDAEMAKIDSQENERKRQYALKQARRERAVGILGAISSTAQGVARALKDYGWPYNFVVGGLVGAAGAVQIANIANTEVPEARQGMYIDGPTHEAGGVPVVSKQTGRQIVEAEGGEVILSRNTVNNHPDIVGALLDTSMNHQGRRINYKWGNPTLSSNAMKKMANGGYVQDDSSENSAYVRAYNDALNRMGQQSQSDSNNSAPWFKTYVTIKDVKKQSSLYDDLQRKSGLNQ